MLENPEQAKLLKKPHKYRVAPKEQRTIDGICFGSRAEAARYCELKMQERDGKILRLELQVVFQLQAGIKYIADFTYRREGECADTIEDVKGMKTVVYRLKKKLFEAFIGVPITEINMDSRRADNAITAYLAGGKLAQKGGAK